MAFRGPLTNWLFGQGIEPDDRDDMIAGLALEIGKAWHFADAQVPDTLTLLVTEDGSVIGAPPIGADFEPRFPDWHKG